MAYYINPLALEAELDYVKNACTQIVIVAAYTAGDSRTTVLAGTNVLASLTAFTSSDFVRSTTGTTRTLTTPASKSDTAADNTGTATHMVLLDGTNVLMATTVTNQLITQGNPVNFPSVIFTANQPVLG